MLAWLKRTFIYSSGDAPELDHLPLNVSSAPAPTVTAKNPKPLPKDAPDYATKRKDAAAKLGHAFKCAADGLPRETMVDGKFVDATRARGENVTKLSERKRKS